MQIGGSIGLAVYTNLYASAVANFAPARIRPRPIMKS